MEFPLLRWTQMLLKVLLTAPALMYQTLRIDWTVPKVVSATDTSVTYIILSIIHSLRE